MRPTPTKSRPAFLSRRADTANDYTVYVDAPKAKGPHTAVVLLDGDYFFDPAVAAARELEAEGRIPPCVLIGVGYGAGFGSPRNFRGRDYTPTRNAEEPSSGGSAAFLAYLEGTFWPELSSRFALRDDDRILAGHSLGSLAVLHGLFQPRPFFTRALASAPSIWWDNRSILGIAERLRAGQDRLEARLYLGVGGDDTPSMTGDLKLLEEQLSSRPFTGLRVASEVFPGFDHYTAAPATLRGGLASLLG